MADGPKNPEPGTLPPADRIDEGRPFGLLLTEDDLSPEDYDLPKSEFKGVAGLTGEVRRSPQPISRKVVDFTHRALDDGLTRASNHFSGPSAGRLDGATWADAIAEWAKSLGVDQVVVPHVPIGPARDLLDEAAGPLRTQHKIGIVRVRRDWDNTLWPLATTGYFPFKERLFKRLAELVSG